MAMNVNLLMTVAIAMGVTVFVVGIVSSLLEGLQGTQTANGIAYNNTDKGLVAMSTFGDWYSIIILAFIGLIILGVIMLYTRFSGKAD